MSQILKLIHKLAWTVGCQNPKFQNFYQNSLEIARAEVKVNGKPLHLPSHLPSRAAPCSPFFGDNLATKLFKGTPLMYVLALMVFVFI